MKLLPALMLMIALYSCNSGENSREYSDRDRPRNDRNRDVNMDDRNYDPRDRNYTDDRRNTDPRDRNPNENFPDRGNTESNQLREVVEKYIRYVKNENWIGVVNLQYPDIAGGQEKTQVAQEFGARFHNEVYDLVTEKATVDNISDIYNEDGGQYAIGTGSSVSILNVKENAFGDPRAKSNFFNNLCDSYVKESGRQNVECDEARGYMKVTMKNTYYLLKTREHNDWYIITKGDKENVKKYIPQSIQDRVR